MSRLLKATNHCVAERGKLVFNHCNNIASLSAGSSGTITPWYGRYYCGEGAGNLVARVGLAPTGTAGTDGEVYLTVAGVNTDKIHLPPNAAHTDKADDFAYFDIVYDNSANAGSAVEWSLSAVDYARPFSLSLFQYGENPVDTANGGTVNPLLSSGGPILDSTHSDLAQAHWDLWRYNATHLFSWSRDWLTSAGFVGNGTYTNIFDSTTTGGAATTAPGFYGETTYHDRVNHDVAVEFAVHASVDSGTTGAVRLVDSSNTTIAEITGIGTTSQWYTTTTTLTAGNALYTIEAKCDSLITISVEAVSLFEYLA